MKQQNRDARKLTRDPAVPPEWFSRARFYYSEIQHAASTVDVFETADGEVTPANRGTLLLRINPRFRTTRVLAADGAERGLIRREGMLPGFRVVMRRDGAIVWTLSVQSPLRKHHNLTLADGEEWMFDTPFFWWQHLAGATSGSTRLLGRVGPSKALWGWALEPDAESFELLAAIAFLHWKWWRW